MSKKVSFEEFEQRLKNKFGDKFKYIDLSLIDKENFNYLDKYPIKCLIHNKIVYKEPKIFLRSTTLNICSECQREQQISDAYKLHKHNERHYTSIDEFLEQLYQKFNNKITINKDDILLNKNGSVNFSKKQKFVCSIHGEFYSKPSDIFRSIHGCSKCANEYMKQKNIQYGVERRQTFINDAIKVHGNQYDYSKVDISGKLKKVEIICNEHGSFFMMPSLHLRGEGCKLCNKTSLLNCERRLYQILIDNFPNEEIIKQFHDFLGRQSLDFYFPKYKIGIEYQGKQHFASVEYLQLDNRHSLKHQQELDEQKFNKCKEHNVKLLYFTFDKQYENIDYYSKIYVNIKDLIEKIQYIINNYNICIDNNIDIEQQKINT